ncbi:MAG: MBL fold metallo-hydrolase [Saccharofermentans sp.]|nr:MBL fold metallo-hydrolase [Saccharofermentans sp.]
MYLLWSEGSYFIVDPCCKPELVKGVDDIEGFDFNCLKAIFITHGHFDHIAYVDAWKSEFPDVPVYMDREDGECLDDSLLNGSIIFRDNCTYAAVPRFFDEYDYKYVMNDEVDMEIIKTPGHSKGSCCLIVNGEYMFSGDMLFAGSVGRTDLPGGDNSQMMASIKLLKALPDGVVVFPGHGPASSMGEEKVGNPYFL